MATIDIVVPSAHGPQPDADRSLTAMAQFSQCQCGTHFPWQCDQGKHSIRMMPSLNFTVIHWARNTHVAMALHGPQPPKRPPAEFFLLADDDMMVSENYLDRMLKSNVDIVTGISTIRRDPPQPNIRAWKPELGRFVTIAEWDYDSQELFEVDGVGAAFILIRRKVLARMGKAYLNCDFERAEDLRKYPKWGPDIDAYWDLRSGQRLERFNNAMKDGSWRNTNCNWFEFLTNVVDTQLTELGEDMSFCWKAKKLGFKIWADPQITPGHIGLYDYSVADHRELMEQQKRDGLVKEIPKHRAALTATPEPALKRL